MWKSIVAVALGAALGALLRWQLGNRLNSLFDFLPPGTLVANLIGAYVVGLFIAFFSFHPTLPSEWRLLIIAGFCGGLTTFSTFSIEITLLLKEERWFWAATAITGHVTGSLLMTFAGMTSMAGIRRFL